TLAAYGADLARFRRWLEGQHTALEAATRADILNYLSERIRERYSARSNARLLSCLKHYFRMQLRLGRIGTDPTALIDAPELSKAVPQAPRERGIQGPFAG